MYLFAMLKAMALSTGFANFSFIVMICFGILFIYFGIKKRYEPFLLIPPGVAAVLVNIPGTGLMAPDGLLRFNYAAVEKVIYPPLIFLGVGACSRCIRHCCSGWNNDYFDFRGVELG